MVMTIDPTAATADDSRPGAEGVESLPEVNVSFMQGYWYYQEFLLYLGNRVPKMTPDGRLDHHFKIDALTRFSPPAAKELATLMTDLVKAYEERFGEIGAKLYANSEPAPEHTAKDEGK